MTTKFPLVSIIMPCYNSKEIWFRESIESVLNQSFKDFELIIVNDCSTNDIEKIILEYKEKDSRIVYLKNEKNLKITKTLNHGLSIAKWKYIARQDDDDIWADKDKLKKQVEFLEEHKDYWLVWTNAVIINQDWEDMYKLNRPKTDKELREQIIVWNRIVHSSILMRKFDLDKVWWKYDTKWKHVEDYELRLRLLQVCKWYILTDSYIKYRVNEKSITISNYRKQKWFALKLMFKYFRYYPKKYLLKASCLHIWELIIPEKWTKFILKKIKSFNVK